MNSGRRVAAAKPLTPRGAATRARIVEAAARLVGERGAQGASLDEVLAASGTSKSQLYHYFADKEALICAVVEAQAAQVIGFQEAHLRQVRSLARLRAWRDALVRLNREQRGVGGCPIGSLANELSDHSEAARRLLVESFRTWERHFVAAFEAMIAGGELDPATHTGELATAVLAALQGGLSLARTTRSTKPLEVSLDMALAHVERCRPQPKRGGSRGGKVRAPA